MLSSSPDVQRVKEATDIVALVGEYVQLRKAGANLKGICPFHGEKTASFTVHPTRQIWHCFGCNQGSDVIGFVQKIEGMDFPDALKFLAQRSGIVLTPPTPQQRQEQSERGRCAEILQLAESFYHQALLTSRAGEGARAYVVRRGLTEETIAEWRLGFAPDLGDALVGFLNRRRISDRDMIAAGLASPGRHGGLYDRFRGRVLFPLKDAHGATVGFTGRILQDRDDAPKYLNTPQTVLYDKGRVLFGMHLAKETIRKLGEAVLVEGQMDVLSSHQAGVKNVIAVSGTALTADQIKLVSRYAPRAVLAFDVDLAGSEATKRGIFLALAAGLDVRVARVPDGKDPDECIRQDPDVWKRVLAESQAVMDFAFDAALQGKNLKQVEDRKRVVKEVLSLLQAIPDVVEREHYLQRLAGDVHIDEAVLREELVRVSAQAEARPLRTGAAVHIQQPPVLGSNAATPDFSLQERLSEGFLAFLLMQPSLMQRVPESFLPEAIHQDLRPLYTALQALYTAPHGSREKEFIRQALTEAVPELASRIDALLLSAEEAWGGTGESVSGIHEAFDVAQRRLTERYLRSALTSAQHALQDAERATDSVRAQELSEKVARILSFLNTLSHAGTQGNRQKEDDTSVRSGTS